jgi:hypothetical protein
VEDIDALCHVQRKGDGLHPTHFVLLVCHHVIQ